MKELIKQRISALRKEMQQNQLDAFIIYGTDPHLSEYIPAYWQTRPFISGFTGSAGQVIVTAQKAALWTDSRYFIQAEEELKGTDIELVKIRVAGYPSPGEWLKINLSEGAVVGTDEACISIEQFRSLEKNLQESAIALIGTADLLNAVWVDRPPLPNNKIYDHEIHYACTDRKDKIEAISKQLKAMGAERQIIAALDEIAWTFNLRGGDVDCNPVFLAYAIVSREQSILFVDTKKLPPVLKARLQVEGIQLHEYNELPSYLEHLPTGARILVDPDRTNYSILKNIPAQCKVIEGLSVPCKLKAVKSEVEIHNIRQAMRKDGVAMLEFLYWLKNILPSHPVDEYLCAQKLIEFRESKPGYKGISFTPIVGYKEHGAIVHFHVSAENALPVSQDGFLLFDSGGQYLDGTTDITRTIALSEVTDQQKKDYTLVLKGMIALSMARFPVGTRGYHLDILARKDLWNHGLNYGHGTGHGVGYFLNVHEGPMSIRQEFNEYAIEPGMVLSNEPGMYRQGEYGIRTENMIVCVKGQSTEFGEFLHFDTLTLCPIDITAVDKSLLNTQETEWLNNYHKRVFEELEPLANDELKIYLTELTKPV
ncbi:MAG TPA: aminopeptidase P family protein [Prolixibacteraceae bacterium]|nr:aminopeptidase P family protein [Prolixibacteraceae bacterium]